MNLYLLSHYDYAPLYYYAIYRAAIKQFIVAKKKNNDRRHQSIMYIVTTSRLPLLLDVPRDENLAAFAQQFRIVSIFILISVINI